MQGCIKGMLTEVYVWDRPLAVWAREPLYSGWDYNSPTAGLLAAFVLEHVRAFTHHPWVSLLRKR